MQDSIDADSIFAELVMQRAADDRAIILVEGSEDVSALDPHVNEDECLTLPTTGNSVLVGVVRLVDDAGLRRIAAISDLDWSGLLYPHHPSPNLFFTDQYDLDATILSCPNVIARVTSAHCDRTKVDELLARTQTGSLLDLAIRIAVTLGALRLLSVRKMLGLNLRKFPVEAVVDWSIYAMNHRRLAEVAIARSVNATVTVEELEASIKSEVCSIPIPLRYCSGHDLVSALAAIMRKGGGGQDGASVLSRVIRSAFSCSDLQSTSLYVKLRGWGETNGVQVWAC
ncbi:hypothetical protein [Micromonospora oryzae]|uniref:hypothetical protein n=1 Tax=Micromonospora sp. DSM 102119 TaxID=3111768 RepID=UPI0031D4E83A